MRWGRLVALVAMLSLWPTASYAASGFWAWLEELSGPGPFHGWGVSGPVFCTSDDKVVSCRSHSETRRPKRLVVASFSRLGSDDNVRFKDEVTPDTREVHVVLLSGTYLFRLHPAVDAGFGAGAMRFSGDGFSPLWRFAPIPFTASVRPLALVRDWNYKSFAYVLRADVETSWVSSGFTAADFGNSTSRFSAGREFLTRVSVAIDLTQFIWK